MPWMAVVAMLGALVFLFLPPTLHAQDADYLIVPGQRVGRWDLGKPLEVYNFGRQTGRFEGRAQDGRPYFDGVEFLVAETGPVVTLNVCKNDRTVFVIFILRRTHLPPAAQPEAFKYKTAEGISIGSAEGDVVRLIGRPQSTFEWKGRHGTLEIPAVTYHYPGLSIHLNKDDGKVFSLGATTRGAWDACFEAVFGRPAAAQATPQPTPPPAAPVRLPVPMPPDLRITLPSSDVPADRAALSGIWTGRWDGLAQTGVAFEEISGSGARIIYSWAAFQEWGINQPGWVRLNGRFSGATLTAPLPIGGNVSYRATPVGQIEAMYNGPPVVRHATMVRVR